MWILDRGSSRRLRIARLSSQLLNFFPDLVSVEESVCAMKNDQLTTLPPKFYTIQQIAEFTAASTRTVRRWIEKKLLVPHYINGLVRISEPDFQAFLAAHRRP